MAVALPCLRAGYGVGHRAAGRALERNMSNTKLPEKWVSEGLVLADGASLFGALLTDLSRDELLAAVAHGWMLAIQAQLREVEIARRALKDATP